MNEGTRLVIPPWNNVWRTGARREPVIHAIKTNQRLTIQRQRGLCHEDVMRKLIRGATVRELLSCGRPSVVEGIVATLIEHRAVVEWPDGHSYPAGAYAPPVLELGYYPKALVIEIIGKCLQACIMCYCDRTLRPMSFELLETTVKQAAAIGVKRLIITGGECTLHPQFFETLALARKYRLRVKVLTCGQTFDEKSVKKLAELHIESVQVSLFSHDSQTHDRITRREGSHRQVVRAIGLLKRHHIKFEVAILAMGANTPAGMWNLREAQQLAESHGAAVHVSTNLIPGASTDVRPVSSDTLVQMAHRGKKTGSAPSSAFVQCTSPYDMMAVMVNHEGGVTVSPCLTWNTSCGDFPRQSLFEIFNGEDFERLRGWRISRLPCRTCVLVSFCTRCPGMAFRMDRSHDCYLQARNGACARALSRTYPGESRVFRDPQRILPDKVIRALGPGTRRKKHEKGKKTTPEGGRGGCERESVPGDQKYR